ncbi:MAG: 1-deoxy-D-xylulose-5-phosphate synthase [Marinifilaceae bacterium]
MRKILNNIDSPADIKHLPDTDLPLLCEEVRDYIIEECAQNPGHLGSSLGVVELTVALHYALNTPYDNLVWDVGHQAYAHKILTGRREAFKTRRLYGGISGFPRISESEYDAFGTGHSSTSISAALGMAIAAKMNGENDRQTVAVIGDGSMTGGMAFEALNNAGVYDANLLVILNDNDMAIDPNVGGFKDYLLDITTSKTYNKIKNDVWDFLGHLNKVQPGTRSFFQNIDSSVKSLLLKKSNLFEAMGLRYFGPVDGHDVVHLSRIIQDMAHIPGPKVLHVKTVKGKGFKKAELEKTVWHAPGKFNAETGELIPEKNKKRVKFQDVFGETILELAKANDKIVGITPAMPTGCSLNIMMAEMPTRCFDVGIAEQHAVTFSAGLAARGLVPFCNIYSSFMQRAYDQVIHDVALQRLNVVFCLDRGGLVGADGATHHGAYDLAYFRCVPGLTIAAPMDEEELRDMMYTAQLPGQGPFVIRYPRGEGFMEEWRTPFKPMEIGKGVCLREGKDVAIVAIGTMSQLAMDVAKASEHSVGVYNMRFLKPLDTEMLSDVLKTYKRIITLEDGTIEGGLGSAVAEYVAEQNVEHVVVKRIGIPDRFVEHGTISELFAECGMDKASVLAAVEELVKLDNK